MAKKLYMATITGWFEDEAELSFHKMVTDKVKNKVDKIAQSELGSTSFEVWFGFNHYINVAPKDIKFVEMTVAEGMFCDKIGVGSDEEVVALLHDMGAIK